MFISRKKYEELLRRVEDLEKFENTSYTINIKLENVTLNEGKSAKELCEQINDSIGKCLGEGHESKRYT